MLKEMIESHPEHLVVNSCESIEASVKYLEKNQHKIDLIFMDIQLADGQSFEIFDQIKVTVPVIFCTAFDEYLFNAFKNNGIDYILKPFKEEDILNAFSKVELLKTNFTSALPGNRNIQNLLFKESGFQTTILVRYREKMLPVRIEDIAFAFLGNEVVYLLNFNGEKHTLFKTLDQFETVVSTTQFYRINRQMMVNRKAVKSIEPYFNRKVVVHLTVPIPEKAIVSRLKVTPFLAWMENRQ